MYIDIFAEAFRGCGTTLEEVVASAAYEHAYQSELLIEKIGADTDTGIAWRAGVMTMTGLLNSMAEAEALKEAALLPEGLRISADIRALTRVFGALLLQKAGGCLPEEMLANAASWRDASPDQQIEMCTSLMHTLQSAEQGAIAYAAKEATFSELHSKIERTWRRSMQGREAVLPAMYGTWDPQTNPANCQGKSQMVAAFAKIAGARTLAIHPSIHAGITVRKAMNRITHMIRDDLVRRDLLDVDSGVMEGIACSLMENELDARNESFHVGMALELSDGRWFMLDPHGKSYGLVPPSFSLPSTYLLLDKYGDVTPGLSIQVHDGGELDHIIATFEQRAAHLIGRSIQTEEDLRNVHTIIDLIDHINHGTDLDELADFLGIDYAWLDEMNRYMLSVSVVLNSDDIWNLHERILEVLGDMQFLEFRKKSWLTAFHAAAFSPIVKASNTATMIHPVVDVGNTEWSLAVAALNTISIDLLPDIRDRDNGAMFAAFSGDQTTIFNVLTGSIWHRTTEVARAAHETLARFQIRHPLSERFIRNS